MHLSERLLSFAVLLSAALGFPGCAAELDVADDEGDFEEEPGTTEEALRSGVSCVEKSVTGYTRGAPYAMKVISVGGKPVAKATAHAFLKMQAAADKAGVNLSIGSGFRSMEEQEYFYDCYQTKRCNNGNLAARPGYSNHQNHRAIDLTSSNWTWVKQNAPKFGFEATVVRERWHWEFKGTDPGGPCSSSARPPKRPDDLLVPEASGGACHSATLDAVVEEGGCVQAESTGLFYQCQDGKWYRGVSKGSGPYGRCTSMHAL